MLILISQSALMNTSSKWISTTWHSSQVIIHSTSHGSRSQLWPGSKSFNAATSFWTSAAIPKRTIAIPMATTSNASMGGNICWLKAPNAPNAFLELRQCFVQKRCRHTTDNSKEMDENGWKCWHKFNCVACSFTKNTRMPAFGATRLEPSDWNVGDWHIQTF